MAQDVKYTGQTYRLRAGAPMPIVAQSTFVLHTFMAEISDIDIYAYTESLPGSEQFRGQGGQYMSASFSRLAAVGGNSFSGKVIHNIEYVPEGTGISSGGTVDGFIDCTSLNISYNIMGIATVSYTMVHQSATFNAKDSITAGGQTFFGYVSNASVSNIPNTSGWYETHVTLIATTN